MRDFFVLLPDEHVNIEVIYLFLQMGHSFTSFCSGIPRNSLSAMAILSLGMESFGLEPCTCMFLHGGVHDPFACGVQAVVELLEGLTCNLLSKGMLEFEAWVAIQDVHL